LESINYILEPCYRGFSVYLKGETDRSTLPIITTFTAYYSDNDFWNANEDITNEVEKERSQCVNRRTTRQVRDTLKKFGFDRDIIKAALKDAKNSVLSK
jgi:DNA replication protein DnaD